MIKYLKRFFGPGKSDGVRTARIIVVSVVLALVIGVVQLRSNEFTRALLREATEGSSGSFGSLILALINIAGYLAVVCIMPALVLGAVISHLSHRFIPTPKRKVDLNLRQFPQHAHLLPDTEKKAQEWRKPSLSNPSSSKKTGRDI